jgi:hypothetical protein
VSDTTLDIVLKPGDTVPFTPPHQDDLPDRTYLIRVPPYFEARKVAAGVRVEGGRSWHPLDIARLLRTEFVRMIETADPSPEAKAAVQPWLDGIDAWVAAIDTAMRTYSSQRTDDNLQALVREIPLPEKLAPVEVEVHRSSRSWRVAMEEQRAFREIQGLVCANLFVVGWEGEEELPPFRRTRDGIPDEIVGLIPVEHLLAIGDRVGELIRPNQARLKNFHSASAGSSSPTASTGSTPPMPAPNGHSPETGGLFLGPAGPSSESIPSTS